MVLASRILGTRRAASGLRLGCSWQFSHRSFKIDGQVQRFLVSVLHPDFQLVRLFTYRCAIFLPALIGAPPEIVHHRFDNAIWRFSKVAHLSGSSDGDGVEARPRSLAQISQSGPSHEMDRMLPKGPRTSCMRPAKIRGSCGLRGRYCLTSSLLSSRPAMCGRPCDVRLLQWSTGSHRLSTRKHHRYCETSVPHPPPPAARRGIPRGWHSW